MDQDQVYNEYLNYEWDKFDDFQIGIQEILDNYLISLKEQDPSVSAIPALDKQQLINQAKSFYYCHKTGNILNLDDFNKWVRSKKVEEVGRTDLSIAGEIESKEFGTTESKESTNVTDQSTDQSTEQPPYSLNYQELVELIVSGKPVPGIKEIPDTVLTEQKSTSTAAQRVKPWERT